MNTTAMQFTADITNAAETVELERAIEDATYFQVRDLTVSVFEDEVRVIGTCDTYYVKQMVTVAVQDMLPTARLMNLVRVTAG